MRSRNVNLKGFLIGRWIPGIELANENPWFLAAPVGRNPIKAATVRSSVI